MGWTTYAAYCSPKTREEERAEIERLYTSLVETAPYTAECLMASKVGSVWYLAIRLTPKPGHGPADPPMRGYVPDAAGRIVYAGVVLTSRRDGEWGYKDLCETMGPHEAQAPLRLLDLLSPLDPEAGRYAQGWRDKVRATHEAKRSRLKVRAGDVIEFPQPVELSGGLKSRRFEAFAYHRNTRSRAQILYRTLDTKHQHTVRMGPKALQDRGARLVGRAEDAKAPADA